jgi:Putative beta-barrel porin 2
MTRSALLLGVRPGRLWCGRLGALVALLLMVPAVLSAQEEGKQKYKYGSFRVGPVYLSLRAPFSVGVDSNVYNTPDGTSDESASVTPTLLAVVPLTRHARIKGSGGVVPQYFHREASQRYTDLFGDVRGEVDAGPLTAFGGVGGGRYRQRFSLEIDDRLLHHEKRDLAGVTLHIGHRVALTGSQTRVTTTFDPTAVVDDQVVGDSLDRRTTTRRGELSFPLTRKTSLLPFVDVIEDRFLHSTPGLIATVNSQRYGAALNFGELAFFTGTVAAGVHHFGADQGVAPYDGPFLAVTLNSPFIIGTHLVLLATRDVAYSAFAPAVGDLRSTYVNSTYRADVVFELPWRFHGRAFGGYLETRYLLPPNADSTMTPRVDKGWLEGAALLRHFGKHLSVGGSGKHEDRASPIDGRSYGAMVYGLAGEVHF